MDDTSRRARLNRALTDIDQRRNSAVRYGRIPRWLAARGVILAPSVMLPPWYVLLRSTLIATPILACLGAIAESLGVPLWPGRSAQLAANPASLFGLDATLLAVSAVVGLILGGADAGHAATVALRSGTPRWRDV